MASNTRPRQPRLRASCDGCFIAKVKCSKARPICSRCLACGLECRYSPSSRAGKPRYDAHNATTQQQPGMSHQGMGRVPEDGTILYHNAYAPPIDLYRLDTGWNTPPSLDGSMGRGAGAGMSAPNDQTRSDHDGGMNLYGIGVSPWLSAADVQQSSFSEISFGQASFTPNMAHSPYSETGGLSIPLVSPWAVAGNNPSQHEVRLYDMSNSLPTPASLGSNCFPSPSATPSVPQCHQSGGMGGPAASISACTCVSFCLESLQGLHNASATSTPSLDMILSLNRKAVESCAALLSCPRCTSPSGTPTVAMLFATILGEAAGLYKMAAHMHFDKPWGVPPNSPLPPPSQQEGGDTSPTALQGQEGLQQGQEALWAELETLARELDRLEEVCSRFRDVCNDLSDDAEVNRAMVGYVSRTVGATMEAIERRQAARFG